MQPVLMTLMHVFFLFLSLKATYETVLNAALIKEKGYPM